MRKLHRQIKVSLLKNLRIYCSWRVFAVFQFRTLWLPACCLGRQSLRYTQLHVYVFSSNQPRCLCERREICVSFWWEIVQEGDHLDDVGVDDTLMLNRSYKKLAVRQPMKASGPLFCIRYWTFGFHTVWRITWLSLCIDFGMRAVLHVVCKSVWLSSSIPAGFIERHVPICSYFICFAIGNFLMYLNIIYQ